MKPPGVAAPGGFFYGLTVSWFCPAICICSEIPHRLRLKAKVQPKSPSQITSSAVEVPTAIIFYNSIWQTSTGKTAIFHFLKYALNQKIKPGNITRKLLLEKGALFSHFQLIYIALYWIDFGTRLWSKESISDAQRLHNAKPRGPLFLQITMVIEKPDGKRSDNQCVQVGHMKSASAA